MTSWADLPYLALDTETTGVDVFNDRIVEVAAATIDPAGAVLESLTAIINPGADVTIPDEAAAVHGITTERAQAEGAEPAEALAAVADLIRRHIDRYQGCGALVIFNATFDWPLLVVEAERHGIDWPAVAGIVDPFLIDRLLDKYRKGSRKLIDVAAHYQVELDAADAHGAAADAIAAGRVMHRIVATYPRLRTYTLATMWRRQVQGHELRRVDFEAYLRKAKSDPTISLPAGWPIPVEKVAS